MWICSPSQFHSDQIIACAKAGKHVFCEKPIATDLQQTILAIDACDAAGVKLMIGLQRRFDKNFGRVKKAMDEKEVGAPFLVRYVTGAGVFGIRWLVHRKKFIRCRIYLYLVPLKKNCSYLFYGMHYALYII